MTDLRSNEIRRTRTAPATLATVKHGGCVQLGDRLPPLPCTDYNAYSDGTEPLFNAQQMRDYARAALSAKPSPGGPDALTGQQIYDRFAFLEGLVTEATYRRISDEATRIQQAALAARQPVGEPVAWMTHHDEPMLYPTFVEAAAYCDDDEPPTPLYAATPAQAVDWGKYRHALLRASGWARRSDVTSHAEDAGLLRELLALIDGQAVGNG